MQKIKISQTNKNKSKDIFWKCDLVKLIHRKILCKSQLPHMLH